MDQLRLWKLEQGDFYRVEDADAAMDALKLNRVEDAKRIVELEAQLAALTTEQPDQTVEQAAQRAFGVLGDYRRDEDSDPTVWEWENVPDAEKTAWIKAILAAQLSDHWRAEAMRKQRTIGQHNDEIKRLKLAILNGNSDKVFAEYAKTHKV